MREFHFIKEFSYASNKNVLLFRFLDGTCLRVLIENLPPKFRPKSAKWDRALVGKDNVCLNVPTNKKALIIPAHVFYASGRIL